MGKYTKEMVLCLRCKRKNNFLILFQKQKGKTFYITQCPKCDAYDEIRDAYLNEIPTLNKITKD